MKEERGRGNEGRRKNRGIGGRDRERKEDVEEIPEV